LADAPHLYADSVTSSDLNELKRVLDRTTLVVANVNANTAVGYYGRKFWEPLFEPSLANPHRELRKWRIAYSKKCINMACSLGAPCVSLTSGRPVPGVSPEQSIEFLRDSLQELLKYAEDRSVRIGIEYEPGLLIDRCEELLMLIEDINSPYLGANLDLGHSHVLGEDPETIVSALERRLFHVHIEDIRARKHYHLIPGTGDINFAELFRILGDHNYEGFATVELYSYPHEPEAAARQALSYLKTILTKETK
jgi:sugar phosphate isomerase/epimerase